MEADKMSSKMIERSYRKSRQSECNKLAQSAKSGV